ncbi:hypothetical protein P885DRAFT_80108 [Corynascus similis CBS 632.67]
MPEPRSPRSRSQPVASSSAWSMEKNSRTPAAPKLRDSCHNCAASKQRCTKEKPSCVRCLKRGKTCEYQQSKRAGRARAETRGGRPQDSGSRQGKEANFIAVSFVSNHASPAVPAPISTETSVAGTAPLDVASPASRTGDIIHAPGWVPTPSPDAVPTSISSDATGAEMNPLCFPSHDMQDMFSRSSETASVGGDAITDSTGDDDPWSIGSIGDFTGAGRLDPDLYSSIFLAPFSEVGSPVVDMDDVSKTSISHQPFSLSLFPPQPQHQLQPQQTPPPAPPPPPSRTASSATGSSANLTRAGSLSSMSLLPGTDGGSATISNSVDPTRAGSSSSVSMIPGADCTNGSVSSQQGSCSCLTHATALLQEQLARSNTNCAGSCCSSSSSNSSSSSINTTQPISSGSANPSSLYPQPQSELRPAQPAPPTAPTVSTVLVQNERTVEAVSGILQCRACGHDRYLLATLALVIFKLLGWYAAAARNAQQRETEVGTGIGLGEGEGNHHHHHQIECVLPSGDSGFGFGEGLAMDGAGIQRLEFEEEEDPGRMVPQLVLSKLYRVKRLVNDLSERLRTPPGRGAPVWSGVSSSSSSSTVHSFASAGGRSVSPGGFGMATPSTLDDGFVNASLSTALLNQIELDLRRRLRALSTEVIDMLRRG